MSTSNLLLMPHKPILLSARIAQEHDDGEIGAATEKHQNRTSYINSKRYWYLDEVRCSRMDFVRGFRRRYFRTQSSSAGGHSEVARLALKMFTNCLRSVMTCVSEGKIVAELQSCIVDAVCLAERATPNISPSSWSF